jgi:four helix bundle protein
MVNFKTLELAAAFYRASKSVRLPEPLQNQFIRASASIALNLGEGNGKASYKEKRRFYQIAMGSLRECQTIFILEQINDPELRDLADRLGGSIHNLCKAMELRSKK